MYKFLKTVSYTCFGNENENENKTVEKTEKTFTQEQVNTFVAEEKRKTQTQQREMAEELQTLKTNTALTTDERDSLQTRIEDLKSQYLTKEERGKEDADKNKKAYDAALSDMTKSRDSWEIKHADLSIRTEITKAAADNKAWSVEQITAILAPKTKLTEQLDDDGQPSGIFRPIVKFDDVDKGDKEITLDLTVSDAVKRMKEIERYGNLFEGVKKGGVGGSASSGSSKSDNMAELAALPDQTKYREARKKNRTARA